jgi:hypothetical protein
VVWPFVISVIFVLVVICCVSCCGGSSSDIDGQTIAWLTRGLELGKVDAGLGGGLAKGRDVVTGPALHGRPDYRDPVGSHLAQPATAQPLADGVFKLTDSRGCGFEFLARLFDVARHTDDLFDKLRIEIIDHRIRRNRRSYPAARSAEWTAMAFLPARDPAFGLERFG